MPQALIVVAIVVLVGLIVFSVYLLRRAEDDPLTARIDEFAAREDITSIDEIEMSLPFRDRVLVPIVRRASEFVTRFTPQRTLENTARQLMQAGNPRNMSASEFLVVRGFMVVLMGALVFLMMTRFENDNRLLYTLGACGIGAMLPPMLLRSISDRRKEAITKKLPDALDLMLICVEAGLTFNGAMQKVNEKWADPLSEEFGRALYEMQLGKSRRQAMKDLSERVGVRDVSTFVAAILQADQLGVGIGKVLRIQAEQMRVKRRQRAEEKAQQAPVKMLFPMVFLIFPSMFVVLLGPAGFQVARSSAVGDVTG